MSLVTSVSSKTDVIPISPLAVISFWTTASLLNVTTKRKYAVTFISTARRNVKLPPNLLLRSVTMKMKVAVTSKFYLDGEEAAPKPFLEKR
jgi:hypothetical protein